MKKKSFIAIMVSSIAMVLTLSSCSFLNDIKDIFDGGGNTCTHEFNEGVCTDGTATCQKKGNVVFTCTLCGYKETRKAYVQHKAANENVYKHDATYHWHECQWCQTVIDKVEHTIEEEILQQYDCKHEGRCIYSCFCGYSHEDTHPAEHYYPIHSHIDATCLENGLETYDPCPGCGATKDDTVIPKKDHHYIGEVCEWCHRDQLLDFVEKFEAYGDNSRNPVVLNSEQEFISLGNYVVVNHTTKYLKVAYSYGDGDIEKYVTDTFTKKTTAANCQYRFGYSTVGGEKVYCIGQGKTELYEDGGALYSQRSGINYTEHVLPNTCDPIIDNLSRGSKRSSTFDNFKINNNVNSMSVSDTDELYYAASHGYKPVCKTGSMSESVYSELKNILRDIVDDSMTDTEKVYQMYNWILNETQYDHGAVTYSDGSDDVSFMEIRAWGIEGVVFDKKAVCDAYSKTLCVMAAMEGIRCIQVSGNAHAWNRVYLDPQNDGEYEWYIMDATWGNASISGKLEGAIASEYLYTDARKADAGYSTKQYEDCPAENEINAFKYLHFGSETKTASNDLYMESMSEIDAYLNALKATVTSYKSANKKICLNLVFSKSLTGVGSSLISSKYGVGISDISYVPDKDNKYYNCYSFMF